MSIISCPSCKKRISSKAKVCSHCNYSLVEGATEDGVTEEQLASRAKLARMKQRYSLQMQAMGGIILFLTGILLWYFLGNRGLSQVSHFIELGIAVIGGAWYLVTRIRLLMFKKTDLS
ncbi:hypothetical protein [Aliikangiella coralliicola]|uniref:Zinc ribbon domain-containing protein n=1 Tax=Aliikangiella coralliicola TaxID=2592383 RepID=A0A545TWB8_9GAMM|nr:hypothetical protein [Aliikangiella coralliicola]TQV81517.1 hypothetical protein FLL46_25550 [Aliikangiella coralliicola]